MGILNATPDSFHDGGKYASPDCLMERALEMVKEGADWIDIGGESTRPGAGSVSAEEETRRILPVISCLKKKPGIKISVDTTKAKVAESALENGASMINDVSGLSADPLMLSVARESGSSVIIVHSRGNPRTMQSLTHYDDVVEDVIRELDERISKALKAGILPEKIWIDAGFGFAKDWEQNILLLKNIGRFAQMGYPLVAGLSRKSFIGKITNCDSSSDRLYGSLAAECHAVLHGTHMLRVHDVGPTREMLDVLKSLA